MNKHIIIVGAGIAGMSAGIYALQSGFDVTICESHSIAGGNATSWKRKGYFFEGGLHWLVGSSEKTPLHKLWHEVGALQENNPISNRDQFCTYLSGNEKIALYRDIDKLEASFLEVSPQDEKAIKQFSKDIRTMMKASSMPITDLKGVKVKHKNSMSLSTMLGYMKAGKTMAKMSKLTAGEYISQFKHEGIRELLGSIVGTDYSAMALAFTLGGFAAGDSGYPKGGSLLMAQNIADKFVSLGGVLEFNKRVERINIANGKANGVWIDSVLQKADAVIVTADAVTAIDHLFEVPLHEPWMDELRRSIAPANCTFVALGVAADLSHLPANVIMPLKTPFTNGGKVHQTLGFNNYAKFDGYAPKGCTTVTMILSEEDTYDEWKQAKEDGSYSEKKQAFAEMMMSGFEEIVPEAKGKIEVWDIATPVTYERYCSTYRGSWMSIMRTDKQRMMYPCKSESIDGLYFAGQRIMIPGGVPSALMTGRTAVQHLCKDNDSVFQCKI